MSDSAEAVAAPADPYLGAILGGRYRVIERLGEGGMGAVYRGEHLELARDVAIKLLAPELARKRAAVERFQREARTASRIGHPNIVEVFDLGRAQDGTPYLVMQLLHGHDLETELRRHAGRLPLARVIEILRPIANALDTCHARGVVHRDVKPSNVFLARLGDGSESPKLVDFGLAMLVASDERLTSSGFLAGTPHYLPPEAADAELPGPAGDVYALATIAFEALSGALPFEGTSPNGLLVQKVTRPAPSMAEACGRSFSPALEAALAQALDRDPGARPPTAAALVDALARAASADEAPAVVAATRRGVRGLRAGGSPVGPSPARRARALALAGLAVSALALAAGIALHVARRASSDVVPPAVTDPIAPAARAASASSPSPELPAAGERDAVGTSPSTELADEGELAFAFDPPRVAEVSPEAPPPPAAADRARAARRAAAERPAPAGDRAEAARLVESAGSLLVRGDLAAAQALLERARAADPTYAPTYRSLGLVHERSRRPAQARAAYERYLRMSPGAADAARIRERLAALPE
ncbi:MAG: protein kinase [Sandaracinaceae bacterium]|nr:protein kinase [Sandaracinaceae bacterium]